MGLNDAAQAGAGALVLRGVLSTRSQDFPTPIVKVSLQTQGAVSGIICSEPLALTRKRAHWR
jgi:hypothetical protein